MTAAMFAAFVVRVSGAGEGEWHGQRLAYVLQMMPALALYKSAVELMQTLERDAAAFFTTNKNHPSTKAFRL
jgi:hypothetical protein